METTNQVRTAPELSFGAFLRNAAETFFSACGKLFEAYDSLPLEQKHRTTKLLLGLSKTDPKVETTLFFKDEVELADTLCNHEWWVLERDINGPTQREILRLGREGRGEKVDGYLCELFSNDDHARLRAKLDKWMEIPYCAERKDMIMECLEAHRGRRFHLSVTTLLPLVDGLTRRFRKEVLKSGRRNPRPGKPFKPRMIEVTLLANYYRRSEPSLWGRPFFKVIEQKFYKSYSFRSGSAPTSLNRHGILHGEISGYGTEANSLRVFLLLDTIQHFYKLVQQRKLRLARGRQKRSRPYTPGRSR